MNIFWLDYDPEKCAKMHCDKHVVKMILETAQLLSTVKHRTEPANHKDKEHWYKLTHASHPCTWWVGENRHNYAWTVELLRQLLKEYTFRYGKTHKTAERLPYLEVVPELLLRRVDEFRTTPPQVVPKQYRGHSVVEAYRLYYIKDKAHFARWTKRAVPEWFNVKQP